MMMMKAWILALGLVAAVALLVGSTQASQVEPKVRFDGHQVLRFVVETEEQAKTLLEFVRENRLDIWSHRLQIGQPFDVNVAPKHLDAIQGLGIRSSVFIPDLQAAIDEEARLQEEAVATGKTGITAELMAGADDSWFKAYQQFTDIQTFVQNLASNYSSFVQYIEIGTTIEGRPIFGVTISTGASSTGGAKPGYFFNGCQHAREWISPMTVTYIMWSLVTGYQQDPNITALVEAFDWTIIPVVNADGYVYTQTNRMWRKNRRQSGGILHCVGVDNNRNWNNHWDQGGSSRDPCSDEYCGSGPFSEPEETAVANWIGNATNVQVYIDFHSYSQLWMTPWGWTNTLPTDYQTQLDGANIAVKALSELHGTQYTTGNIYATIYEATGSSTDWVYNAGVKWSYAVELRDQGQYGFTLPPTEILPSGKETLAGVLALAQYVQQQLAL